MDYLLDRCSMEQVLFFHEKAVELEEHRAIIQAAKQFPYLGGKPKKEPTKSPSEQMREIYGSGRVVTR